MLESVLIKLSNNNGRHIYLTESNKQPPYLQTKCIETIYFLNWCTISYHLTLEMAF